MLFPSLTSTWWHPYITQCWAVQITFVRADCEVFLGLCWRFQTRGTTLTYSAVSPSWCVNVCPNMTQHASPSESLSMMLQYVDELFPLTFLSVAAERQGGSSRSHRALEVTIVTAWRCIPWRSALRLSTIICSADWARGVTSAPPDVEVVDRGTGVSVNRLSRIGSGDLTGTARKARRETCQMWALGLPTLKWRCGSKTEELWLRSSSLPPPILTTAGLDIALTQVTAVCEVFGPVNHRNVHIVSHPPSNPTVLPVAPTNGSQDS